MRRNEKGRPEGRPGWLPENSAFSGALLFRQVILFYNADLPASALAEFAGTESRRAEGDGNSASGTTAGDPLTKDGAFTGALPR